MLCLFYKIVFFKYLSEYFVVPNCRGRGKEELRENGLGEKLLGFFKTERVFLGHSLVILKCFFKQMANVSSTISVPKQNKTKPKKI